LRPTLTASSLASLQEKTDWDTAKKVMSESGFVKRLVDFNKDAMSASVLKKLSKYIEDPAFTPDAVAKQSAAAKSLCMWVRAMDVYARVAKVEKP
jgi:dynein heavy chain